MNAITMNAFERYKPRKNAFELYDTPKQQSIKRINKVLDECREKLEKNREIETASTGTPIKDLYGAAKSQAEKARDGGGSKKSGGGGVEEGDKLNQEINKLEAMRKYLDGYREF